MLCYLLLASPVPVACLYTCHVLVLQQMPQGLSHVLDPPQTPQLEGGSTTQKGLGAFVAGATADLLC